MIFFLALLPPHSHAQELARRIVLKDGTFQSVNKYEVKGDRVRYLSAERNEWEELPASLVDWAATEKYEKDRAAGASVPEAAQLDKEVEKEHESDETKLPEVAPGLRLPQSSGVYLLETFHGEPQLIELQQTAGDLAQSGKVSIFHGIMNRTGSIKENIELDGEHAHVQAHVDVPSFYIKIDEDPAQPDQIEQCKSEQRKSEQRKNEQDKNEQSKKSDAASNPTAKPATAQTPQQPQQPEQASAPVDPYRIVRTQPKSGRRIVGDVKRAISGKVSQEQTFMKTTITRVNGGWFKVTPAESLLPGEYALVEMVGKEGMNLYVWDFGFNPKAPANTNPYKAEAKPETKDSMPAAGSQAEDSPK